MHVPYTYRNIYIYKYIYVYSSPLSKSEFACAYQVMVTFIYVWSLATKLVVAGWDVDCPRTFLLSSPQEKQEKP